MTRGVVGVVEKAVRSTRLFLGADGVPFRSQQKLYRQMNRDMNAVVAYAAKHPEAFPVRPSYLQVYEEIHREAVKRGFLQPFPGKDY